MKYQNISIAFILVVYKEPFYETVSFRSFTHSLTLAPGFNCELCIYDNTDSDIWSVNTKVEGFKNVYYFHDPRNSGISMAYNHMAEHARERGIDWLLFADQDTFFPPESVSIYLSSIINQPNIQLKAPVICASSFIFSPMKYLGPKSIALKHISSGVHSLKRIKLINSGLLVSRNLFNKVGGYNKNVRLDFSDLEFIRRVKQVIDEFEVLQLNCHHSYSFYESDQITAIKRYASYLKDIKNCTKYSISDRFTFFAVGLIHLKNLTVRHKTLKFLKMYLRQVVNKNVG